MPACRIDWSATEWCETQFGAGVRGHPVARGCSRRVSTKPSGAMLQYEVATADAASIAMHGFRHHCQWAWLDLLHLADASRAGLGSCFNQTCIGWRAYGLSSFWW